MRVYRKKLLRQMCFKMSKEGYLFLPLRVRPACCRIDRFSVFHEKTVSENVNLRRFYCEINSRYESIIKSESIKKFLKRSNR